MLLGRLASFLDVRFGPAPADDVATVWRHATVPIRTLALALDYGPHLAGFQGDALLLHRPWKIGVDDLPGAGILAVHRRFDAQLTTGWNLPLAASLDLRQPEPLIVAGQTVGMVAQLDEPVMWQRWIERVGAVCDGIEDSRRHGVAAIETVAIASVMRADVMALLAANGVQAFVTGQMRVPGLAPAERLGIGIVAVGHRRSERWGLCRLAFELTQVFPGLDVRLLERP
ncbi:MAG: Nif3-like dinuclear metal center hexameric protein [Candidatus Sericytochromatia bacterium]|nr:Nif3-like dinuclear metal center hexameric protein [Candidatus Sericytochromatia bacterium]